MGELRLTARCGALLLAAGLATACSGAAAGSAALPSTPTHQTVQNQGVTTFIAHDSCHPSDTQTSQDGYQLICDRSASDARIAGSGTFTTSSQIFEGDLQVFWGAFLLENGDGAWLCRRSGLDTYSIPGAGGLYILDEVCTGRGAYDGLKAYSHGAYSQEDSSLSLSGWIEPAQ